MINTENCSHVRVKWTHLSFMCEGSKFCKLSWALYRAQNRGGGGSLKQQSEPLAHWDYLHITKLKQFLSMATNVTHIVCDTVESIIFWTKTKFSFSLV